MPYLDHNSTAPLDPRALTAMLPYLQGKWGNASSRDHAFGWDGQDAVEEARAQIAFSINAKPNEILFTSGATESIALTLLGFIRSIETAALPDRSPPSGRKTRRETHKDGGILLSAVEHQASLGASRSWRSPGLAVRQLSVSKTGSLSLEALDEACHAQRPALVCLMAANNETGVLFPIRQCAAIAHTHGATFFTDAAQALGKIPLDAETDGFDMAAFSAHKLGGPKGIGALYLRGGPGAIPMEPLLPGGGQEGGLRGGTLNVPGIVGFGEACRLAGLEMTQETSRLRILRDHLEKSLLARFPKIRVNGLGGERLSNTANLCLPGIDARALIRDMHDVAVSTRSACSSGSSEPSHVLKAMGLSDADAFASIRFSLGKINTREEIDLVIEKVSTSYAKLLALRNPI